MPEGVVVEGEDGCFFELLLLQVSGQNSSEVRREVADARKKDKMNEQHHQYTS